MNQSRLLRRFRNFSTLLGVIILALLILGAAPAIRSPRQNAQPVKGTQAGPPHIYLQDGYDLPVTHAGAASIRQALASGQAEPLALASGDFFEHGITDLVVGYTTGSGNVLAVHQGNLDAFAPQSEASWRAIANNAFPPPFLNTARVLNSPVRPDFLAAGEFSGQGHIALIAAARGGNTLYLFDGKGNGQFSAPRPLSLPGTVTAVASGHFGANNRFASLLVGVSGPQHSAVLLYAGSENGLSLVASYPLPAPATAFAFGDLNGDGLADAAMIAGGQAMVLYSAPNSAEFKLEPVSLPATVNAIALGRFLFDRIDARLQMALLSSDGSILLAAHNGFDPRMWSAEELKAMQKQRGRVNPMVHPFSSSENDGWKIVETFPGAAPSTDPSHAPLLLRTRISSRGGDDVLAVNREAGQMVIISHANLEPGAASFKPGEQSIHAYSSGTPVAALSTRVGIDARPGLVMLNQGKLQPSIHSPLPDPTFTVNTTNDVVVANACANNVANSCSLREAIIEANATPGVDTIMVPAGTYTLTIPGIDESASLTGDLNITDGVNIVGAGSSTTIIQAGTSATNGIDRVLDINPNGSLPSFDTSLSNLTIRFGRNSSVNSPFGGNF
ncbi:MAG TPA: hypothetical protein VG759_17850, partial [Candidatus Angelobacter sp.]|nr:hypothetical protein [Candidatus Angelobacter sp.]